jgi:hypothetical protein
VRKVLDKGAGDIRLRLRQASLRPVRHGGAPVEVRARRRSACSSRYRRRGYLQRTDHLAAYPSRSLSRQAGAHQAGGEGPENRSVLENRVSAVLNEIECQIPSCARGFVDSQATLHPSQFQLCPTSTGRHNTPSRAAMRHWVAQRQDARIGVPPGLATYAVRPRASAARDSTTSRCDPCARTPAVCRLGHGSRTSRMGE